jgi:hypothetical protein
VSRRLVFAGGGLALVVATALAVALTGSGGARGSALSRGVDGWLAARRYLEARGCEVTLIDRAEPEPAPGVLVLVFPWQRPARGRLGLVRAHLAAGGDVLVAYAPPRSTAEFQLFENLGLDLVPVRSGDRPRWFEAAPAEERLTPVQPGGPGGALVVPPLEWLPTPPAEARPLYRTARGETAAFVARRGRGRLLAVPAAALANAGLGHPEGAGNADLLETLRRSLPALWRFDEYVHGLTAPAPEAELPGRVIVLAAVHFALLYAAGVWALGRRFGPPWREAPAVTGSTAAMLLGLGALHHRLGHHREAARLLAERSAALARRPLPDDHDPAPAAGADAAAGLVARARRLAAWRRSGSGGRR